MSLTDLGYGDSPTPDDVIPQLRRRIEAQELTINNLSKALAAEVDRHRPASTEDLWWCDAAITRMEDDGWDLEAAAVSKMRDELLRLRAKAT